MALIASPPIRSSHRSWGVDEPETEYDHSSKPSTYTMSYSYDEQTMDDTGVDLTPSNYSHEYAMATHQTSSATIGGMRNSASSFQDRGDPNLILKRSFSTPNTETVQQSSQEQQSGCETPGEKKRNKLGYHRTSIACSHCRRRKIRCITSPDIQNRCSNCIRLKKECSFFPVDQQPSPDERSKGPSRTSTSASIASESPSSGVGESSPAEMPSQQPYIPMTVAPIIPSMPHPTMQTPSGDYFSPETKVPSSGLPSNRLYDIANQSTASWMPTGMDSNTMPRPGDLNAAWRSYPAGSPMNTQPPHYSHTSSAATWAHGHAEPVPRHDLAWSDFPPPTRSMSYSGEGTAAHPQSQYLGISQGQPYDRRVSSLSDAYTPSMDMPIDMGEPVGSAIDPTGSMVAAAVHQSDAGAWSQQMIPREHNPYAKHGDAFGEWGFGEAAGSSQM